MENRILTRRNNRMKPFKEKRIVTLLDKVAITLGLIFPISLIGIFFSDVFLLGLFVLPIVVLLIFIGWSISDKDSYTDEFIKYINQKLSEADSLDKLYEVRKEFINLATDGNGYLTLSYPVTLRKISEEIGYKIQILEKIKL